MEKSLKIKLIVGTILVLALGTAFALFIIEKYTPSETMRLLDDYYDVASDEAVILMENEIDKERALLRNGAVYLPLDMVHAVLNSEFYLDEKEQVLRYVLPEELICAKEAEAVYYSNGEKKAFSHPVFLRIGDRYYLSLEFTSLFSDMSYEYYEAPNRVVIHHQWTEFLYYDTIAEETPIRVEPDIKSDILRKVWAGEKLYYIGGTGAGGRSFLKVMTQDGIFGYVQKKFLGDSYYEALTSPYVEPEYRYLTQEDKVCLGWHMVTVPQANNNLEALAENAPQMNVISPTWYRLSDTQGGFTSLADADYVERAHSMGLKVWALIDNFDKEVSTLELLSSSKAREDLIDNMMKEAETYGFDGWNIDFETLSPETRPHFVQFLKELSVRCRLAGLVLSVDNYVPAPYNESYDLKTQGRFVDYVIIMAYDEHHSDSPVAGSVASIGFLKKAVNDTLAKMPKERIIMAVPFYTRLWTEQEVDGEVKVSSEVVFMKDVKKQLEEDKVTAKWDAATGQNYAEYKKDGNICKIWLEDLDSLHERMKVIAGADVAGVAAWRLGQETEDAWQVIDDYMKQE